MTGKMKEMERKWHKPDYKPYAVPAAELNKLDKQYPYGDIIYHAISKVVPSHDVLTGQLVREGKEELGEYDFVVEWNQVPTMEQVRGLIRQVDQALLYTGCMYMITTK